jgi:hypothetical protein
MFGRDCSRPHVTDESGAHEHQRARTIGDHGSVRIPSQGAVTGP